MKKMIKTILKFFTKHKQKYVWAIAIMYNIRVEIPEKKREFLNRS